ncbi:MAG TPA: PilZ domain-containing protein [Terriglobales bacterium]|nr:PilZ domain-containing protein [Terriglobales bacterium]
MSSGDYYQVCLRCGAEYGYDWNTMRRTDKVRGTAVQNRGSMNRAAGWKPRARRIHIETPILYRSSVEEAWTEGTIRNVSQSGVYFVTDSPMPTATELEVIFTMPQEIAGQSEAKVFCRVEIIRRSGGKDAKHPNGIAIEILTCEYLHERRQPRMAEAHV